MPSLFRVACEHCDADAEPRLAYEGFSAAVTYSLPGNPPVSGGEIIADAYVAYLDDSGNLIPLPHPCEDTTLQQLGKRWEEAARGGRILCLHALICRDCGEINRSASLVTGSGLGCVLGLIAATAMLLANVAIVDLPIIFRIILVVAALFIPPLADSLWIWLRYRHHARRFAFRACSRCGSPQAVEILGATGKQFPCKRCGQRTLWVIDDGIS